MGNSPATQFKKGNPGGPGHPQGPNRRWLRGMVTDALKKKLASYDKTSHRVFASMIADRLVRCITHPNPDVDKTVIMAWHEIVDRVEGKPTQQVQLDVTHELDIRSDAELKFFLKNGTWPDLHVIEPAPKVLEGEVAPEPSPVDPDGEEEPTVQ